MGMLSAALLQSRKDESSYQFLADNSLYHEADIGSRHCWVLIG